MSRKAKVKRNDSCPCGSGNKYKHCCKGRADWNEIFRSGIDWIPFLSVRGRNIYFANRISEALQLDDLGDTRTLKDYKAAFTTDAVRKIHEAIMEVWPPDTDINSVLENAREDVTGLYIGDYGLDYVTRGLVRHSIYANKILVVDPFIHPKSVRDEYNPVLNPEQYRAQTLKNVNFFFSLLPWIHAGIVEVIRTPADFDHKLNWDSMKRQKKKFEENEELKKAAEISAEELSKRHTKGMTFRHLILGAPDSYLRQLYDESDPKEKEGFSADDLIAHANTLREQDPNSLGHLGSGPESAQLLMMSTGASYEIAKLTASLTGSYLITDLHVKWKEIELDRNEGNVENRAWTPFAKALQSARLRYLNELSLEHALCLRKEGRLEKLRAFLHGVWRKACSDDPFEETNAVSLASELVERVREAEEEWKQIDRDLLKIVGTATSAELLAAGPLIASGHGMFLAAASVVAGSAAVISSAMRHKGFPDRFPAAFFLDVTR